MQLHFTSNEVVANDVLHIPLWLKPFSVMFVGGDYCVCVYFVATEWYLCGYEA